MSEKTVKYKACNYAWEPIQKVEIDRETDASVWVNGSRRSKKSDGVRYCDTFNEAKQFLLSHSTAKLETAKRELRYAQETHDKTLALTEE